MSIYKGTQLISGVATPVQGARNIGQIIQSTIPLTDAGLHLLDGALIDGNGIYSAFVDYIASIYDASASYFTTEASWQDSVTNYGVCGKFVYDSVNNTVRLPKITGFTEGTIDPTTLGDLTTAGLPNIYGHFTHSVGAAQDYSGAFTQQNYGLASIQGGYGGTYVGTTFDASRSSSIYGNSNTVQPQSIKVLYYIVIATSTKTDIQVDIDEITTDLNGKADTDLSNVSNTSGFRRLIDIYNNGTSWYKVYAEYNPTTGDYIGKWCEQGSFFAFDSSPKTVSLLKECTDINYSIYATNVWTNDFTNDALAVNENNKTTSSFQAYSPANNTNSASCYWRVCGYIN